MTGRCFARFAFFRFTQKLSVNDVETRIVAAPAGRRITRVLSYQVAADIRAGKLVRLLESFKPDPQCT